ncbi:MAG: hypothetical protein Kow001_13540 [Acidobacteriota bacterium]
MNGFPAGRSLFLAAALSLQMSFLAGSVPSSWQFFAQVGDGGGLRTVFLIMNPNEFPCHVSVSLIRSDGTAWPLGLNDIPGSSPGLDLPAGGSIRLATPGTAPGPSTGWAVLRADRPVTAQALFEIRTGGTLVAQAAVEGTVAHQNLDLFFDQSGGSNTGIAVANPSGLPVGVYVTELAEDGTPTESSWFTLEPNHQTAKFVAELLGGGARKGILRIAATGPVVVTSLQQTGLVLATLPVASRTLRSQPPVLGD